MRFALPIFLLIVCSCASVPKRDPAEIVVATLTDAEIENYAQAVAVILRPRLFHFDRPAITFHYEEMPASDPIQSLEEANARLLSKPGRFAGMLTGLYSEADPKGSRSFGKERPGLFVLEIATGSFFLDDTHPTEAERARLIKVLHLNAGAKQEYSAIHYINNMDADYTVKNKIETRVIELLGTDNRLYHFNEAAQKGCRYNGIDIALQLKDPKIFKAIAYYSDDVIIEASPMSAKIKRLFDETSFLNGSKSRPLPRHVSRRAAENAASKADYKQWKTRFILTCGPRWAFE